ncbi:ferredoxin [Saccharothrix sp. 6-C]|uniref:Ferredoxin n=1 Tax=Saccharothrix texasensis TaxID=103734 RepID=A0A3N1H5T8_9PSEU|nr:MULTISPECIES: ferredoxin [Saccharothrix]QQQ77672.1 ferredoxin [Saccharothrix sp. 6-C]ROP37887.1 ferredoxin [Saccharothrix texasensis]
MSEWTIEVDKGACLGTGMCTSIAPDHFRLDGGTATPINSGVDPDDAVIDAAESCPMEAILVRSSDGTVLAPQL